MTSKSAGTRSYSLERRRNRSYSDVSPLSHQRGQYNALHQYNLLGDIQLAMLTSQLANVSRWWNHACANIRYSRLAMLAKCFSEVCGTESLCGHNENCLNRSANEPLYAYLLGKYLEVLRSAVAPSRVWVM